MPEVLDLVGWNQLIAVLMCAAVWFLCRTRMLSRRPAVCHGLWLLVLLKFVTPPVIPVPVLPAIGAAEPSKAATLPSTVPITAIDEGDLRCVHPQVVANQAGEIDEIGVYACPPVVANTTEPLSIAELPSETPRLTWRETCIALLGASLFATFVFWIAAARRFVQTRRLLRGSAVDSGRAAGLLKDVSQRFDSRTALKLLIVEAPLTPMLWAEPGNAAIVLPRQLADSLSDEQLCCIMAHELGHFVRRDHWTNLFAFIVTTLFWWNPVVWFARRRVSATAEACCDSMALERLAGSRKSYAQTLLQVVDSLTLTTPPGSVFGMTFGESNSLKRRFEMIADTNVKARVTRGGWILLALGIASLALVPARAEQELDPPSDVVEEQPDSEKSDATEPATAKPVNTNQISKPEAVELANLREVIRMTPVFSGNCHPGDQIGSLILSGYWKKILPLNKAQTRAILELEDLLQESRELSWYADADHPADDLASYQAFLARSRLRREEAIYHAQRVVSLGLLTEAQAAFVLQHVLSSRKWKALYSLNVQNLLGISEEQKEELLKVGKEAQDYYTLEPEKRPAVMQRLNAAYMDVLTPSQKEMWSRLTAEQSLPAEPPKLSALTAADAERVKLEDLSPTFRALSDNPRYNFGVTAYQKRLLDDLAEVTREGVYWISLRVPKEQLPPAKDRREQDDRTSQTTARFVKHAEQVALLGILTEGQAERVRAAIQEKN